MIGLVSVRQFGQGVTMFGFACGCTLTLDQSRRPVSPNPALFACALHRRELGWEHETFDGTWESLLAGGGPADAPKRETLPITRRAGSAYDALMRGTTERW